MKPFQYHEPTTVKEACQLIATHWKKACVLAGGTDLIIKMKKGVILPEHVINIKKIPELNGISETSDGFKIGSITSLSAIANHEGIKAKQPMVGEAALTVGSLQVRNLATLGGNLCNGAPSADMAPGLLVLDSLITLSGVNGDRKMKLEEFFVGPGEVNLKKGEILKELFVPFPDKDMRMIYLKHGPRRAMDCALVGVAVALVLKNSGQQCESAKIALGAVAPTPVRAKKSEKLLSGKSVKDFPIQEIKKMLLTEIAPISDVRASATYRAEMISSLTLKAIENLVNLN
ncbi:MAG: xanthine dehydrogenase family protein subunit M [Desulfobacterales bacterium]|nr:MAG: xanthine dehydrogenase family protein subunit M [Desulfobacterales bacterium]